MKIKVEVDLSEFYSEDEELTFTEQIKDAISYQVTNKIRADFKKEMIQDFTNQIKDRIDASKAELLDSTLAELISEKKIKKPYGQDKMCSIAEYVESEMERLFVNESHVTREFDKLVREESKKHGESLVNRYDMLFASQIVNKLNETGMLKEDVARLLLPKKGE